MGDYATTTELIARFGSSEEAAYATDAESTGTPSTTVLDECIDTAEGEINSYLSVRYETPVDTSLDSSVENLLRGVTLDISEFHVLNRGPNVSEQKTAQYERRIEWLKMIAKGEANLTGGAELPGTEASDNLASWSGSDRELPDPGPRICSRETMSGL